MSNKKTVPEMPSDDDVAAIRSLLGDACATQILVAAQSEGTFTDRAARVERRVDARRSVSMVFDALIARARAYREPGPHKWSHHRMYGWIVRTEDGDEDAYVWATDPESARAAAIECGCDGDFTVEMDIEPEPEPVEAAP